VSARQQKKAKGLTTRHTILLCAIAFALCLASKPNQVSASYQQESGQQGQGRASSADDSGSAAKQDATKREMPHWYASPEWILVIVGSFTFIVIGWQAWETRRAAEASRDAAVATQASAEAVRTQVGVMERQTKATEDAAIAAKEGAEAASKNIEMFISKERARLKIGLKPLDLNKEAVAYTVDFTVDNYGSSAANVIETGCVTYALPLQLVGEPDVCDAVMFPMHSIPSIIPPNKPPLEQYAFLFIQEVMVNEVVSDRMFVGIRGFIKYRDMFDRERETRFRYVWKYHAFMPTPTGAARWGSWEKCGSEEENKET
jgi:hypothetical protein